MPEWAWKKKICQHPSDTRAFVRPIRWCCMEARAALQLHESYVSRTANAQGFLDHRHANPKQLRESLAEDSVSSPDLDSQEDQKRSNASRAFIANLCTALRDFELGLTRSDQGWVHQCTINLKNPTLLPCFDELTSGWLAWAPNLLKGQRTPLWLTVAFQVLIDITATLGKYSPSAADDLRKEATIHHSRFSDNLRHRTSRLSLKMEGQDMPRVFDVLLGIEKCIIKSEPGKQRGRSGSEDDALSGASRPQPGLFLIEINPLLCGMQAYWLEREYRNFKLWAVKLHESIVPAALLYMAARKMGKIGYWCDMELASEYSQLSPPEIYCVHIQMH